MMVESAQFLESSPELKHMQTLEFHIRTSAAFENALSDALTDLGAAAITCQDAGNQAFYEPAPGEYRQWQETLLIALFENDENSEQIAAFLTAQLKEGQLSEFSSHEVADKNWVIHSQAQLKPMLFGKRLWVCPSWESPPDPSAIVVTLDPGCAFGTGTHPTTALCLEWLDEVINGGETLIDYGCGSGILAIAALKLGAKHAIAVDHDPEALDVTRENANNNDIPSSLLDLALPDKALNKADIVIANILALPLINLAPLFADLVKPKGKLALSGILYNQSTEVLRAYEAAFDNLTVTTKDEWVRIQGTRK